MRKVNGLSAHELRQVAVAAEVDPDTVKRYAEGRPLRALSRQRIERALKAMGGDGECPILDEHFDQ